MIISLWNTGFRHRCHDMELKYIVFGYVTFTFSYYNSTWATLVSTSATTLRFPKFVTLAYITSSNFPIIHLLYRFTYFPAILSQYFSPDNDNPCIFTNRNLLMLVQGIVQTCLQSVNMHIKKKLTLNSLVRTICNPLNMYDQTVMLTTEQ